MHLPNHLMAASTDSQIVSTRIMDAPKELVFKVWSDPEHLKNWWGPKGFTNTFKEFDFRPGGKWSFIMHGPDKKDYPNESVFVKIDKTNLVAFNHVSPPHFQLVGMFDEMEGNKTKVTFAQIFGTPEECNKIKKFVLDKNEENMDRLETELRRMKN